MMEEGLLREGPPEGGASEPAPHPFLPHCGPGGAGGQCEGLRETTGPCRAKGSEVGTPGRPMHPFLGSSSQGPIVPATDPDPNVGSLGVLCSGETAQPRAVWEPEDLIPYQVINGKNRLQGLRAAG